MKRLLMFLGLGLAAPQAMSATVAPHRAVYDLNLVHMRSGTELSSVKGRLAFEVDGSSCEGWSVNFRMMNNFQPVEGIAKLVDTQSTSFESGDGLTLRYDEKEFINRNKQSDSRITVSRDAVDKQGKGELGAAGTAPFMIPGGAAFPMQHQLRLMTAAENGQQRDDSVIYDGSDADKLFRAITFIGRRKPPGSNARDAADADAAALAGFASWPVTISYYRDSGENRDTPDYQVTFDIYENGVATGLVLDYGEFVLGGDLAKLEMLKAAPCP